MINRTPLRDAMMLAGITGLEDRMTYQDYLNIAVNTHGVKQPITEEQWETLCDILGSDRPLYASNVKMEIQNIADEIKSRRTELAAQGARDDTTRDDGRDA